MHDDVQRIIRIGGGIMDLDILRTIERIVVHLALDLRVIEIAATILVITMCAIAWRSSVRVRTIIALSLFVPWAIAGLWLMHPVVRELHLLLAESQWGSLGSAVVWLIRTIWIIATLLIVGLSVIIALIWPHREDAEVRKLRLMLLRQRGLTRQWRQDRNYWRNEYARLVKETDRFVDEKLRVVDSQVGKK